LSPRAQQGDERLAPPDHAAVEGEEKALHKELGIAIDRQPDIAALHYLGGRPLPDSLAHLPDRPRLKLSLEALIEEHGDPAIVNALPRSFKSMVVSKGGVRPSEIAGPLGFADARSMVNSLMALAREKLLGFADGRSLIGALAKLAREQDVLKRAGDKRSVRAKRIDDGVDRKMLERHGLALVGDAFDAEALRALHNDASADMLAGEMRALARLAGRKAISYQEARDWVRHEVAENEFGKVGDMSEFTAIEARAAFAAREAWARGNLLGALQHKQEHMLAHVLWREVDGARERAAAVRRQSEDRAAAAGVAIAPVPRSTGGSENGPGEWRAAPKGMQPPAIAYQKQITGRVGEDYVVDGVKFDGFSDGALIEVKGPGYAKFVTSGEFNEDYKAGKKLLKQARNQSVAANGIPIIWHVADSKAADAIRALFEAEGLKGVTVYHTAVVYKRARR